jgi:predicted O-methyltransferase YrrM
MPKFENAIFAIKKPFRFFQALGFHVTPVHFYEPIPDTRELSEALWERPSDLPGIDMNDAGQLLLLNTFMASLKSEYEALPRAATSDPRRFFLNNSSFYSVDAEALYCFIRHFKPKRMIEIGSGMSTLLAAEALRKNELECDYTVIDPFPDKRIKGVTEISRVIAKPVQAVPVSEFATLGDGDILFIDSSHVLRIGSDVQYEFLEILPRLAKGVIVHVHDIFLPAEYHRHWVLKEYRFWTEQYILQAFLAFNKSFEVLFGASYLHLKHRAQLQAAFSSYDEKICWPGSFWMRKVL